MENNLTNLLQHFGRDNQAGPDPASVELMAASSLTGRRLALASFTWVTYEMIITFDQSVNLFWKQKWTPSKVFFLLNRFAAVYALLVNTLQLHVVSPSALYCKISPWLQSVGALLVIGLLTLSMALRVRALWCHSRVIITITMVLFVLNILTIIGTLSYGQATAIAEPAPLPLSGCAFKPTFRHLCIFSITTLAFETFVLSLIFLRSSPLLDRQKIRLPLSVLLFQDGVIYYIVIASVQLLVLITGFVADYSVVITLLPSLIIPAVAGVACNRMFIRLQNVLLSERVMVLGAPATSEGVSISVWVDTVAVSIEEGTRKYDLDRRRDRIQQHTFSTFTSEVGANDLHSKGVHSYQSPGHKATVNGR